MKKYLFAIPLCLALAGTARAMTPAESAETCKELGRIVYLTAILKPTGDERRELAHVKRRAAQALDGRPAIPAARIRDAVSWGDGANGAHGPAEGSRYSGLLGALDYQRECLAELWHVPEGALP